ncbi:MAG: ABC transporter ATP-binding protein [Dehalococcoidia bacterium]|nr:ABC transporter ATP-binding protein [Dehalococcoidia bacterium]MDW8120305.1 ABC transporter ATP-binding protein [Chloroflexota bacterium]
MPPKSQPVVLEAQGVWRVFRSGGQEVVAVRGVDLQVRRGEFLAIMGRSGSGKTTLLNILATLDRPTQGRVLLDGQDLTRLGEKEVVEVRRKKIGFVFQFYGLLPLLSAYENVELPLRVNGVPARERRQRVLDALTKVGLAHRAQHRPYELSGGEQQRVAIARAIATRPLVLFADEPTGELDTATGMQIATLLQSLAHQEGVTVVTATHDPVVARMADRVVVLVDGTIAEGTPPAGRGVDA